MSAIPVIQRIYPFDATAEYIVKFNISGSAQQVYYNELTLYDFAAPSVAIYQTRIQSFQYQHTIPANTLTNGSQYIASIKVFDSTEALAGESESVFFYCFTPPTLEVPTIVDGSVGNQTVLFTGTYSQPEGEPAEAYQFKLYDDNQNLLSASGAIFLQSAADPMEYEFAELESRRLYYLEFIVSTVNEMYATTGLIAFTPRYLSPRFKSAIELKNNSAQASVDATINVIRIIGTSDSGAPLFDEATGTVDLRADGFTFGQGFDLHSNFTIEIWASDIQEGMIFKLSAIDGSHFKILKEGNKLFLYKMLNEEYILQSMSDTTTFTNEPLYIFIQQKDGWLEFKYEVVI